MMKPCGACKGTGDVRCMDSGGEAGWGICFPCGGTGKVDAVAEAAIDKAYGEHMERLFKGLPPAGQQAARRLGFIE